MEPNNKEILIAWELSPYLNKKFDIYCIIDSIDGFFIYLRDVTSGEKVKIIFEDSVDAYRNTDESFRLKTINDFFKNKTENYDNRTLFKVESSQYIKWLSEESFEISNALNFIHFIFVSEDSILDVITTYEPTIEFINEK